MEVINLNACNLFNCMKTKFTFEDNIFLSKRLRFLNISFIIFLFCFITFFFPINFISQISIPNTTPVTQNFDGMLATTTTPANWKMHQSATPSYAGGTSTLDFQASSGTPATGGKFNWGTSGAERALGVMTSGSYASPNSIMAFYRNTNTQDLTDLSISYDLERYRINTASASVQFFYSTDGSTWTAVASGNISAATIGTAGASAYSFAPQATFASGSFAISGLSIASGADIYLRWNLNTTGSNSQGIGIDNVSVTATFAGCALAATPTVNANAVTVTTGSTTASVSFTGGNGSNVLAVITATDCSIVDPVDGSAYTANTVFGIGSITAAGDFVVYNGIGSSFSLTGLSASTTYCINFYEFNGSSLCTKYMTSSVASAGFTTTTTSVRPFLTGVMINSCDATCAEGNNEIIFGTTADYSVLANTSNIDIRYGNSSPASVTYTDAYTNVPATTTTLNTACPGTFLDGNGVMMPVGAKFMIVRSTFCPNDYTWTNLCGAGPIYVLYSSDATWVTLGNFDNSGTALRYFRFNSITTSTLANTLDYSYIPNSNPSGGNGAFINLDSDGGAPTSYSNNGCVVLLPLDYKSFEIESKNNAAYLVWSTYTERNNDYFEVEMADVNGLDFLSTGRVDGNGSSSTENYYSFLVENMKEGYYYFRLKQVDYNGDFSYSEIKSVTIAGDALAILKINKYLDKISLNFNKNISQGSKIEVFEITGKQIYSQEVSVTSKKIEINENLKGMLLIKVSNPINGIQTFRVLLGDM